MKKRKISKSRNDIDFIDSDLMNSETYFNYLDRFKKVALSIFIGVCSLLKTIQCSL